MLRRAAPLVRTLRTATSAVAQSSSSAVSNVDRRHVARGGDRRNMRKAEDHKKTFRRDFKPHLADEHQKLFRRHGDSIENSEVESLNDAIERINWYSSVSKSTIEKVANMLKKSSIEELNAISDRSMSTLFSSFGEHCKEKRRDEKRKLVDATVKEITAKGYTLGPLTRASIFTAKVDMAKTMEELPSIVDEISAWESAGVSLNEEFVVQAARVYAMQGDKKGVIELTNYARESFGRVEVQYLHWLAFSMVASTEGNGLLAVERLSRSAPDSSTRLWLNGALAAAYKADLPTTLECLSRVPLVAKLNHSDQNVPVVDILIQLIERGVEGAEQGLSAYLSLSGDGSSLHERHASNSIAIFKARRAINEGNMNAATRLYTLVHDMQKNKAVEYELKRGIEEMAGNKVENVEEVKKCTMRLQEAGIIENANAYLLGAFKGAKLIEFINQLRNSGELFDAISKCEVHRFYIANELITDATSSPIISVVPTITALLYSVPLMFDDRNTAENLVFKAVKGNPDVVVKVLEGLAESNMADAETIGSFIITAALGKLLMENDVFASGRIEKMIATPFTPVVRLNLIEKKVIRLIRHARDEESINKATDIASEIIIAAFNIRGARRDFQTSPSLIRIIGNTTITDQKLEILVNKLSQNPVVGISPTEIERVQEELVQRGLKKRVELIGLLRMKSQASQRWFASSPEDLDAELNALEKGGKASEGVLDTIRTILMNKLIEATISTERMIPLMERLIPTLIKKAKKTKNENEKEDKWEGPRRIHLKNSTEIVYGKALKNSVMEGDWNGAVRLWKARGSLRSLPVSSALALAYHELKEGSNELSNEIISIVRSNGQSVSKADITELGEFFMDRSTDELSSVSEWLKKELRLDPHDIARINNATTRRSMGDLINGGRLQDAFNVMEENSNKSENAIGHFDVMRAAIRELNVPILGATVNLVASLHSFATARLDLAFSFLLENKRSEAEKLLKDKTLKLSYAKLSFFIKSAVDEKRPDVIHSLFTILASCPLTEEKVSNSDLNYLAANALRGYVKSNKVDEAKELMEEIEKSYLVIEKPLKELIDRTKNTSRSTV